MRLKVMIIIRVILQFLCLIYDRFSVLVRCLRLDALHYRDRPYNLVDVFFEVEAKDKATFYSLM
jgi:hypothetical protein